MNESKKKWLLFIVTLALIGGSVAALAAFEARQRLGPPGLVATPVPGSDRMAFDFPAHVLDFNSTNVPEAEVVLGYLPKDTSFAQRRYFAPDGAWANANLILMGADRTSIHRPDYCLPGQGWQIRDQQTVTLDIGGAHPYQLPVEKWTISNVYAAPDGTKHPVSGLYVFWFVTAGQTTGSFPTMLKSMLFHQLRTGELQRWAYVSWFTACEPGKEDAAFARMKALITAAVPQFQLPPNSAQ